MKYRFIVLLSILAIITSHLSFNYLATIPTPSSTDITGEEVNFKSDYGPTALTWEGGVKILQLTISREDYFYEVHEFNSHLDSIKNYTIALPYNIVPIAKLTSSGEIILIYMKYIDDPTTDDTFVYNGSNLVFSENIFPYLIAQSRLGLHQVSPNDLGLLYESDELSLLDRSNGKTSVIYTYLWKDDHFQQSGSYFLQGAPASIESMYRVNNYYYILGDAYLNPYITTDTKSILYKINLQSKETSTIELNNDYNNVILIHNQTYYIKSTGYSASSFKFDIYDDSNQLIYHLSPGIIVEPIIRYNSIQSQIIGHTSLSSFSEIGGRTFLPLQKNNIIKTLGNNEDVPFALFMGNDEIQVLNIPHELTNEILTSTNYIGSTTDSMIYTFTTQNESKLISLQITVKNNSIDFPALQLPGVLLTYVAVIILNTRQVLKVKNVRKVEELYPES